MRSSRLLCYVGRVAPLLHSLGFRHLQSVSLLLRLPSQVLRIQKVALLTLVHLGNGPLLLRLSSQVLRIQKMTLHPAGSWTDYPRS